jgi:hypothetical protein
VERALFWISGFSSGDASYDASGGGLVHGSVLRFQPVGGGSALEEAGSMKCEKRHVAGPNTPVAAELRQGELPYKTFRTAIPTRESLRQLDRPDRAEGGEAGRS